MVLVRGIVLNNAFALEVATVAPPPICAVSLPVDPSMSAVSADGFCCGGVCLRLPFEGHSKAVLAFHGDEFLTPDAVEETQARALSFEVTGDTCEDATKARWLPVGSPCGFGSRRDPGRAKRRS